jgi:Ca2+-dependent lipid-binding protein
MSSSSIGKGSIDISKVISSHNNSFNFTIDLTYEKKNVKQGQLLMRGEIIDNTPAPKIEAEKTILKPSPPTSRVPTPPTTDQLNQSDSRRPSISEKPLTSSRSNSRRPSLSTEKQPSPPPERTPSPPPSNNNIQISPRSTIPTINKKETEQTDEIFIEIRITAIVTNNLKNVESFGGKNDTYLKLSYGELWKQQTSVVNDQDDATWDYSSNEHDKTMTIKFKISDIKRSFNKLNIIAMDKNRMLSDKYIGEGNLAFPLSLISSTVDDTIIQAVDIYDKKSTQVGSIKFSFHKIIENDTIEANVLESGTKEEKIKEIKTSETFVSGTISIKKIQCTELKNVELIGKNDPYVKLTIENEHFETEYLENGGSNVIFENLDMTKIVEKDFVEFEYINVQVYDKNSVTSDVFVGEGQIFLKSLLNRQDTDLDFTTDIIDKKSDKVTGKVTLYLRLDGNRVSKEPLQNKDIQYDLSKCLVRIANISFFDLKNASAIISSAVDKPFAKLKFGEEWNKTTKVGAANSKGSAVIDYLDLDIEEISVSKLKSIPLSIEVWDIDMITNSYIGNGEISLEKIAYSTINDKVSLRMSVQDKKGRIVGRLILNAVLMFIPKVQDAIMIDDKDVLSALDKKEKLYFHISSITVHDIKNTEIVGKQDPYVSLNMGSILKYDTSCQEEAGDNAHWTNLDIMCDVSNNDILNETLLVNVFDKNTTRSDVLIGSTSFSLRNAAIKYGEIIECKSEIKDIKGKSSGFINFSCIIKEKINEADLKVKDDFIKGYIHIQKILAFDLHGETMYNKLEPFVNASIGEEGNEFWKEKTFSLKGKNPVWDNLLLKSGEVTADDLATRTLSLEVFDDGIMKETLIGKAEFKLLKAGAFAGEQVEYNGKLIMKDSSGNDTTFGRISMFLAIRQFDEIQTSNNTENVDEFLKDFNEGILCVTTIRAFNLAKKELLGQNDPYVKLKVGDWEVKTDVFENAGNDVIWNWLDFSTRVTTELLKSNPILEAEVWEENKIRSDVLIGSGNVSLRRPIRCIGTEISLVINLTDTKRKSTGRLDINVGIRAGSLEAIKQLPEGFESAILHIFRLRTFDLTNTELVGLQDPFLVVTLDSYNEKTHTLDNAGGDVLFDYLDMKTIVTQDILRNKKFQIEAWDENVTSNTFIGKSFASLKNVVKIGEEVELNFDLKDKNGKPSGRVTAFVKLLDPPPPRDFEVEIASGFDEGFAFIRRICSFGLHNINIIPGSKQDPYVSLKMNSWAEETNVLIDGGTNCIWDMLDLQIPITKSSLSDGILEVEVKDKKNIIGSGRVPIRRAGMKLDTLVELSIDLNRSKSGKVIPSGRIVVYIEVKKPELEEDLVLDPMFQSGILTIDKISTFNLKNTEIFGLQDPYCVLKCGIWTDKTYTKDNAGGNVIWNYLNMSTTVYSESILRHPLEVLVYDENTASKDVLIGNGSISLLKCGAKIGEEVELHVSLTDEKTKEKTGKVVLYSTIKLPEIEQELPNSFDLGVLSIKRISILGLKNSKMFGKNDPFIHLKLDSFDQKTKTLQNEGSNPTWDYLDYKVPCDHKIIRVGSLLVEAWDEKNLKDSKVGFVNLSLRRAGSYLDEDTEISAELQNDKGDAVGRVILLVQLNAKISLPEPDLGLPDDFIGNVIITKIQAKGLKNKELIGKQDPFVRINYGDWNETTATLDNSGSHVVWDHLHMEAECDCKVLKREKIEFIVMDENTSKKDDYLGTGIVSSQQIRRLCVAIDTEIVVPIDLSEKGQVAGQLLVTMSLKKASAEATVDMIPDSAVQLKLGKFIVKGIKGYNLVGGDKIGQPDPYVTLSCDNWNTETSVISGGGRNPEWKDIDPIKMQHNFSNDIFRFKRLNVTVKDSNVLKDAVMGIGDVSLKLAASQPGNEVTLIVKLKDPVRNKKAGKIEIFAEVVDISNTLKDDMYGGDESVAPAAYKNVAVDNSMLSSLHDNVASVKKKQKEMEKAIGSMSKNLRKEIEDEQLQKNYELNLQIENLKEQMELSNGNILSQIDANTEANEKYKEDNNPLSNLKISGISNLKLPKDALQWRTVHVQAWLAITMELPLYMDNFQRGSIDGLVLTRHVDEKILNDVLGVTNPLHVQKLLAGIASINAKQKEIDKENAMIREIQLKKRELESNKRRIKDEEMEREKEHIEKLKFIKEKAAAVGLAVAMEANEKQQKKPKKKKKMKKVATVSNTNIIEKKEANNDIDNGLARAKIVQQMRQSVIRERKESSKMDSQAKIWAFEYTGASKPEVEKDIWDPSSNPTSDLSGSKEYNLAMKDLTHKRGKISSIPSNCSLDEVLTLTKGAMYELSTWLLRDENIRRQRQKIHDSDLKNETKKNAHQTTLPTNIYNNYNSGQIQTIEEIDEESTYSEPPPPFISKSNSILNETDNAADDDSSIESEAPPRYVKPKTYNADILENLDEPFAEIRATFTSAPTIDSNLIVNTDDNDEDVDEFKFDRMTLVFNKLINQQNNNAHWLGPNSKLTRMKLNGGFENLLRLRIEWSQFDALWTKLDYKRSGDIDLKEFKTFFGDLSEFENLEGSNNLALSSATESMQALIRCMYKVCDTLRDVGFSVIEMFSGFDRNGSGDISFSEFCSLLRVILGPNFDKKLIYRSLNVLDEDGNKSVSREEFRTFIYKIWRSQLDELADQLEDCIGMENSKKIDRIVKERKSILHALKRNFNREWRDRLKRESGHTLPGPFTCLLQKMNVQSVDKNTVDMGEFNTSPTKITQDFENSFTSPSKQNNKSFKNSPTRGNQSPTKFSLSKVGTSEVMRFKIKVSGNAIQTRNGTTLQTTQNLNNHVVFAAENAHALLRGKTY